jgi:hypothetical protein
MKVLKGFGLALLSIILFISLVCFGVYYTVSSVPLNPHFYAGTLDDIDLSQITKETLSDPEYSIDISPELQAVLIDAIDEAEPVIKDHLAFAIKGTLAYLKGKTGTPDLETALGDSIVNSEFVADLLEAVDLSELCDEILKTQGATDDYSGMFTDTFTNTIDRLEPSLKQQIVSISDPVFKYLLGETADIDLKTVIRQTLLSDDFFTEIIESLDLTLMTEDFIKEQIDQVLPGGIQFSDRQIDTLVVSAEPYLKQKLAAAADDIADYLMGIRPGFSVSISVNSAVPSLKLIVKEAYITHLPPELVGASQSTIDNAFEIYYADFRQTLPASVSFNSNDFPLDIRDGLTQQLSDMESSLADVRDNISETSSDIEEELEPVRSYFSIFNIVFISIIILSLLVILGIVLIHRNVKGACLNLGLVFFIYGAIFFTGLLIAKSIIEHQVLTEFTELPQSIQFLPEMLLKNATSPLQIFSLICLIGGILLIVASFVYPRLRTPKANQ